MSSTKSKLNVVLCVVQGFLAALFILAGLSKLLMSAAELTAQSQLPLGLLRFVGVAELAGALGLILPGITKIKTFLTPLAAAGLVIIMLGATAISASSGQKGPAAISFLIGFLLLYVGFCRWKVSPHPSRN